MQPVHLCHKILIPISYTNFYYLPNIYGIQHWHRLILDSIQTKCNYCAVVKNVINLKVAHWYFQLDLKRCVQSSELFTEQTENSDFPPYVQKYTQSRKLRKALPSFHPTLPTVIYSFLSCRNFFLRPLDFAVIAETRIIYLFIYAKE